MSEVANLRLNDVRDANGTIRAEIYLSASRVKHGHARTVYVSTRLQEELDPMFVHANGMRKHKLCLQPTAVHAKHSHQMCCHSIFIGCSKLLASKAQAATVDARRF